MIIDDCEIMRTVNVSERLYSMVKFGSEVYNESLGSFLERFIDALCLRQDATELITRLKSEIEQNTRSVESEHSELTKEGLNLIREISPEKAKELEERLEQIKSQNTFPEDEKKLVN